MTDSIGGRGLNARDGRLIGGFNTPPVADLSYSPTDEILADATDVMWSASGSNDQDGVIESYEWTFPDTTLTGETVTHELPVSGDQDVTLSVVDDGGQSDKQTVTVTAGDPTIDDFEDGEISEYDQYDAQSSGSAAVELYQGVDEINDPYKGDYFIQIGEQDTLDEYQAVISPEGNGLPLYLPRGNSARYHIYHDGDDYHGYFLFGATDGSNFYGVRTSPRNGSDTLYIVKFDNGNITILGSADCPLSSHLNEWLIGRVDYGETAYDDITASIETTGGTMLGSVTVTDTTHETAGIGFQGSSTGVKNDSVDFDFVRRD